jgi:serine/threonine-protein kinase
VEAVLEELRRAVREGGARLVPAVGLYAEARVEGEADEDALRRMDELLERASEVAREAGLTVVVDGAGCLFAAAALPEDAAESREARRRVLEAALALVEPSPAPRPPGEGRGEGARQGAPAREPEPDASVSLAVTVHVDLALPGRDASGHPRLSSGGLLRLSEWTGAHPSRGLVATRAALGALESSFRAEPLADEPNLWRVSGA